MMLLLFEMCIVLFGFVIDMLMLVGYVYIGMDYFVWLFDELVCV